MNDLVGVYAIHTPTKTVGNVRKVYAQGDYKDPNGQPIDDIVVEFSSGHAFLSHGDPTLFKPLSPEEVQLYSVTKQAIVGAVVEIAEWAKAHNVNGDNAADIIVQVLKDQALALTTWQSPPPDSGSAPVPPWHTP